jgi:hypothetical protein
MNGSFAPKAAVRTSQNNSKSCRKRRKHGIVSANDLVIAAWLVHATYGLENRLQNNDVNTIAGSCCISVAGTITEEL